MLRQKGWKLNNSADEPISLSLSLSLSLSSPRIDLSSTVHRPWDLPANLDCLQTTAISLIRSAIVASSCSFLVSSFFSHSSIVTVI